jgi:hypothetical protein
MTIRIGDYSNVASQAICDFCGRTLEIGIGSGKENKARDRRFAELRKWKKIDKKDKCVKCQKRKFAI